MKATTYYLCLFLFCLLLVRHTSRFPAHHGSHGMYFWLDWLLQHNTYYFYSGVSLPTWDSSAVSFVSLDPPTPCPVPYGPELPPEGLPSLVVEDNVLLSLMYHVVGMSLCFCFFVNLALYAHWCYQSGILRDAWETVYTSSWAPSGTSLHLTPRIDPLVDIEERTLVSHNNICPDHNSDTIWNKQYTNCSEKWHWALSFKCPCQGRTNEQYWFITFRFSRNSLAWCAWYFLYC